MLPLDNSLRVEVDTFWATYPLLPPKCPFLQTRDQAPDTSAKEDGKVKLIPQKASVICEAEVEGDITLFPWQLSAAMFSGGGGGGSVFLPFLDGSQVFSNTRAIHLNRLMNTGDGMSLSSLHK